MLNDPVRRVLVIVDTPASVRPAVDAALSVTGADLCSVTLAGVAPRAPWTLNMSMYAVPIEQLEAELEAELSGVCREACQRVPGNINARHLVMKGQLDAAVAQQLDEGAYDLAVVCRPSRGGFTGWARALQLDRLMRRSAIPFMCVPVGTDTT